MLKRLIRYRKRAKITIQASSGLSDDDIEKMKQDAEKYAEEDKKKREEVDKRNEADALVASIDKLLSESADKISDDHKSN